MIIKSDLLKKYCSIILQAVDNNELSILTETLELKTKNDILYMNVTNKEYYAQVKLGLNQAESLHATVNANLFLKLISQITTSDIELTINSNTLIVKGNGSYKLPLIFDNNQLLELPEININNVTNEIDINSDILNSVLQYNSKELLKGTISRPIQKLYYIDNFGAITFTSGACVNNFNIQTPFKLLLNDKLVKLFKLFQDTNVHMSIGYDALSDTITQTKVKFESSDIKLTAIISCDDSLLNSVPVQAIRGRAMSNYPYSINIDKTALLSTINRLMLFNSGNGSKEILKPYSQFEFNKSSVTVWDASKINNETIEYTNTALSDDNYSAMFDLMDLKSTLENCSDKYITINFGDSQAAVIARGNIYNVIPEVRSV